MVLHGLRAAASSQPQVGVIGEGKLSKVPPTPLPDPPATTTRRDSRGPLRSVRGVDDAGEYWHATLSCGHAVDRRKTDRRLTVFSRCHCLQCLQQPQP
jgi:hypothetical protein